MEQRDETPREHPRRRRVLKAIAIAAVALTVVTVSAGSLLYVQLNDNIKHVSLSGLQNRPPVAAPDPVTGDSPMNVLLMGSDTRSGINRSLAGGPQMGGFGRSDTMMLLHVSADHQSAAVMSLPRDTMIDLPTCTDKQGGQIGGYFGQINTAYDQGGPVCA